jgi:hypothetical protein
MNIPYAVTVIAVILIIAGIGGCLYFCRSRRKYRPERASQQYAQFGHPQPGYKDDYELPRQPTFGEQPPEPYEPTTPYSPIGHFTIDSPYTPIDAYTPVTPKTWKKEEITNWPHWPHKDDGYQ